MMRELQEAVEEGGPAVRLKDLLLVWFAGAPLLDTFLLTHIDCIGFSILSITDIQIRSHKIIQLIISTACSAHRRGALYRDFQPNPIHPIYIAFEHLHLYKQMHLSQSVAVFGEVDHGRPKQSQV